MVVNMNYSCVIKFHVLVKPYEELVYFKVHHCDYIIIIMSLTNMNTIVSAFCDIYRKWHLDHNNW